MGGASFPNSVIPNSRAPCGVADGVPAGERVDPPQDRRIGLRRAERVVQDPLVVGPRGAAIGRDERADRAGDCVRAQLGEHVAVA
eukprot:6345240-Pyramimonas_sp.AAC.1